MLLIMLLNQVEDLELLQVLVIGTFQEDQCLILVNLAFAIATFLAFNLNLS